MMERTVEAIVLKNKHLPALRCGVNDSLHVAPPRGRPCKHKSFNNKQHLFSGQFLRTAYVHWYKNVKTILRDDVGCSGSSETFFNILQSSSQITNLQRSKICVFHGPDTISTTKPTV